MYRPNRRLNHKPLRIRRSAAHPPIRWRLPIPWHPCSGCRGRPLCLPIRNAPAAALKKGRHRGLPLRAAEISPCAAAQPNSPCVATGRCELQATPQNPTSKTPPPNRLPPIHPRQRGTGAPNISLCPSGSNIPRGRSKDVCLAATTVPGLVSPAGGGGHAPRVAGGGR
jgi:hypothetical protein